jgi:hypothetical protein
MMDAIVTTQINERFIAESPSSLRARRGKKVVITVRKKSNRGSSGFHSLFCRCSAIEDDRGEYV